MDYVPIFLMFAIVFVIVAAGPIAFFVTNALRERLTLAERRIAALEAALRAGESAPAPPPRASPSDRVSIRFAPAAEPAEDTPERSAGSSSSPPVLSGEASRRGLEERLGANWTVWVGGVALALGGLLLVRYSIEQGFFGPAARCAMGLAFGVALAIAGEFMRRRERSSGAVTQTPAILTAAGTVAAFGAIYAAHGLYGFIGPAVAFVALGAVAIASILAAALHGPWLAGLGLVGACSAPLLVTSGQPNPWPVVLYLAVATGAAYALARIRHWLWLACAAAAGAALWAIILTEDGSADVFHAALVHTLISAGLAAIFIALLPYVTSKSAEVSIDPVATTVVGGFAAVACFVLLAGSARGQFDLAATLLAGAIVTGLEATGAIVTPAAGLAPIAGALALAVLHLWPGDGETPVHLFTFVTLYEPLEPTRFAVFAAYGAAVVAALCARRLASGAALSMAPAGLYAIGAAVTPLAVMALAYLRLAHSGTSIPFAVVAGLVAAGFALLAQYFRRGGDVEAAAATRLALGAFAAAALTALALGLVFVLDRGMLTVALALAALAAAGVAVRLDIGALRDATAAMGLVIFARLIWEPRIVGADLGATPIFNWLLAGYGVPALAFGYAARLMRRASGEDRPVRIAQALSILFAAFLVYFEIRHALRGGDIYTQSSSLIEQGLLATSALLFSSTLTQFDRSRASPVFGAASIIFGAVSVGLAAIGLAVDSNPVLNCEPVEGGVVFNGLLLGYAAPSVAAAMLMRTARGIRPAWFTTGAGVLSLALLFLYACLETRRLFHAADLCSKLGAGDTEVWAYSAVWLALGILLLLYGIARRMRGARLASALFVLAAALKIFLYDLSGLEGLMRALSFIGLGLVLIGIGLVYQKLVLPKPGSPLASERSG